MGEFEAITSQEQLDGILKDRLARKDAQTEKAIADIKAQYSDYDDLKSKAEESTKQIEDLKKSIDESNAKYAGYDAEKAEMEAKLKEYEKDSEKTKIALEYGIINAKSYIQGETVEEMRKSAEELKTLIVKQPTPMKSTESPAESDGVMAAFRKLNPNIKI